MIPPASLLVLQLCLVPGTELVGIDRSGQNLSSLESTVIAPLKLSSLGPQTSGEIEQGD
jgi:hypothetical protein